MTDFQLIVETDRPAAGAEVRDIFRLRLLDRHGRQQCFHECRVADLDRARWLGLLDARAYVARRKNKPLPGTESPQASQEQLLAELGVFLAQEVLGASIAEALGGAGRRTLGVHLPNCTGDLLAAALARVPWEIGRLSVDLPDFLDGNLVIQVTMGGTPPRNPQVTAVARQVVDGLTPLRVLLVQSDVNRASPLAWRDEREYLLERFACDIMHQRDVEVDVLSHGVTRALLEERIRASGGYHIIHWTGHGQRDSLEMRGADGQIEDVSGAELVQLIERAGGFIPQLVFLGACLSGTLLSLQPAAKVHEPTSPAGDTAGDATVGDSGDQAPWHAAIEATSTGFTGTALALLQAGVPQVVAMRYRVADAFARELAGAFYGRLLADREPRSVEDALHLARRDVADRGSALARRVALDRANPLAFGHPGRFLVPAARRSTQLSRLRPRPQPLLEDRDPRLERRARFIGRTGPLTELHLRWLTPRSSRALAVVRGPEALGKTALAAEAVHLWHARFDWVLGFVCDRPTLTIDDFYRQLDERLTLTSRVYRERCQQAPYERIYLQPDGLLTGRARYARMRINLAEALRYESILLVIDGFQGNLVSVAAPGDGPRASQDPEWDPLLVELAQVLPATRSRLLMTTSVAPSALVGEDGVLDLQLGPLPDEEARLFVWSFPELHQLMSADADGFRLGARLLRLAAGRPTRLLELAPLAADRPQLVSALEQLEPAKPS